MATLNEALETLRGVAEANTANATDAMRRPSWAPALVLDDKITSALADLKRPLKGAGAKVARLWATFAGPGRLDTILRNNVSTLPLPGVRVKAFELRLGTERAGLRLLLARRHASGTWHVHTVRWRKAPGWREAKRAQNEHYEKCRHAEFCREVMSRKITHVPTPGNRAHATRPCRDRGRHRAAHVHSR